MQKFLILIVLAALALSCSPDKKAQLEKLKAQKEKISEQITALELEISESNGNIPEAKLQYVSLTEIKPVRFDHFIEVQGTVDSENNIAVPAEAGGEIGRAHV